MNARTRFDALADALLAETATNEVLLLSYYAETSDFVRLNHARVRQAGHVSQHELRLELVIGARHASINLQLQGDLEADLAMARGELAALRTLLPGLPEDPYLDYAETVNNSESVVTGTLGDRVNWLDSVADCAGDLDLVGLLASGTQAHGFANSLGQRNWHAADSFNFDWSLHGADNRAVKGRYAGSDWQPAELAARIAVARSRLDALARPPVTPVTGNHRAYLAPSALGEIMDLLGWGGFSLKALRTGQSPLQRLADGKLMLSSNVSLEEARLPAAALSDAGGWWSFRRRPDRTAQRQRVRHAGQRPHGDAGSVGDGSRRTARGRRAGHARRRPLPLGPLVLQLLRPQQLPHHRHEPLRVFRRRGR